VQFHFPSLAYSTGAGQFNSGGEAWLSDVFFPLDESNYQRQAGMVMIEVTLFSWDYKLDEITERQ